MRRTLKRGMPKDRKKRLRAMNLLMWSIAVRMRDLLRCQICGGERRLVAHHIIKKSAAAEHIYDIDNGILLCSACHGGANDGPHGPRGEQPFMCWLAERRPDLHSICVARVGALRGRRDRGERRRDRIGFHEEAAKRLASILAGGDWEAHVPARAAKWKLAMIRERALSDENTRLTARPERNDT